MKNLAAIAIVGLASAAMAPAAHAATTISLTPTANFASASGSYGRTGINTSTFKDVLTFNVTRKGTVALTLSSVTNMLRSATDITFYSVLLNNKSFAVLSSGLTESRTFAGEVGPGLQTLTISGGLGSTRVLQGSRWVSTRNGTYSGTVAFTAAAPEPGTWLMMLAGFGMVGGAMRSARRRQKQTLVAA
jgi:hypothetical protein